MLTPESATLAGSVAGAFLAAPLASPMARLVGSRAGLVLAVMPAVIFAALLFLAPPVLAGKPLTWSVPWIPELGVRLSLRLDGLSLLFGLLIAGVGTLILIYASEYMADHATGRAGAGRLLGSLLLFMGAMLGVVLADNVLTLFVFWELTSVASYLLIGFDHHREKARKAALQALLVTGLGGLALLVGLVLLGRVAGTMELSGILASGAVGESPLYPAIALLVIAGAATKSAQFPFHFWLPSAMEAPTPVSAYLHSSTMVKAGVYLLARMEPSLGGTDLWRGTLIALGCATVVAAAVLAVRQTALKKLLAYTTVLSLGLITLLLGLGTDQAAIAAMGVLLAHALYKGCLFMVAGALTHATGEKDAERLSGLARAGWPMAVLFGAALLAGASMAGVAPLLGFISKEVALEAALNPEAQLLTGAPSQGGSPVWTWAGATAWLPEACMILGALALVLVAGLVGVKPFVGAATAGGHLGSDANVDPAGRHPSHHLHSHVHLPGAAMLLGPVLLAALSLIFGLVPAAGAEQLVSAAAGSVRSPDATPISAHLKLWHGVTPALLLSVGAIVAGVVLYLVRRPVRAALNAIGAAIDPLAPASMYSGLYSGGLAFAGSLTSALQHGRLRGYVALVMLTVSGLVWAALSSRPISVPEASMLAEPSPSFYHVALAVLAMLGAVLTAIAPTRLKAVTGLGLVGIGVTGLFASFGGPDLAMTQISVDALAIVLFLVAFRHLPDLRRRSGAPLITRDAVIALGVGLAMGALTYIAATRQLSGSISEFFSQRSVPDANGRNVVNVILVDFRALDTLGEITVVAIAGLGVLAMLKGRGGGGGDSNDRAARQRRGGGQPAGEQGARP